MEFGVLVEPRWNDIVFLVVTAAVAAAASFAVFFGCFYWFRREQRRLQRRILNTIAQAARGTDENLFVSGHDAASCGELVAQFKVNQGRQVVSVLESDGRRFIHVDGELTAPEREKMVRYLKSEGFMT